MIKLEVTITELKLRVECERSETSAVMQHVNGLVNAAIAEPIRRLLPVESAGVSERMTDLRNSGISAETVPGNVPRHETRRTRRRTRTHALTAEQPAAITRVPRAGTIRDRVLNDLRQHGPSRLTDIANRFGRKISHMSPYLSSLKKAGLANNDRDGLWSALSTSPDTEANNSQPEIKSDEDGDAVVFRHVGRRRETKAAPDETTEPSDESSSNEPANPAFDAEVLEDIRQNGPTTKAEIAERLKLVFTDVANDPLCLAVKRLLTTKRLKSGWRGMLSVRETKALHKDAHAPLENFLAELPIGRRDIVRRSGCRTPAELAQLGRRGIRSIVGAGTHTAQHLVDWLKRRFGLDIED